MVKQPDCIACVFEENIQQLLVFTARVIEKPDSFAFVFEHM